MLMQERGCLQVAMDPSGGSRRTRDRGTSTSSARGNGDRGGGVALQGLKLAALLLHLLSVVGAAPRPECVPSNGTDLRAEQRITSGVNCTNLVESKKEFNLTLSQNSTGASLNEDHNETTGLPETVEPGVSVAQIDEQVKPPSGREPSVQRPVTGGTLPVRQSAKRKRDLGVLGRAMAIGMIIIIICLGSGITVGYIYKRGQAIKREQEQRAREQEIQRIMLPLSAFTNPTCELEDEVTVMMVNPQALTGEDSEADSSRATATGTPGA
ncbi:phosphoinositide-3-kinase-interacting protein 1 [Leucoraja erinacea]|uniref:phosphoinositide-3-kinase-interacting protein 1 n=1 Tax=Leucoraja erinaceus TaxID=7782 RepID=UPI002453AC60|nr:phosphoinositide-3-kinase-interacting protein 1 [Leucoraja erinacea]